jgi:ribosomal protein S13
MRNIIKIKFVKSKKNILKKFKKNLGVGQKILLSLFKKFGINKKGCKKIKVDVLNLIDRIIFKLTFGKNLLNKLILSRKYTTNVIKNYKGLRHVNRYPARGQRTRTNSNTRKKFKDIRHFLT